MPEEMSIDDRLKFLLTSTESLHSSLQELSAQMARQDEKQKELAKQFNRNRRALLAAIRAYMENDLEEGA